MPNPTTEGDLTPEQLAERDRQLVAEGLPTDAEFAARVRAWDARHPEIVARLTADQRGY